MGHVDDAARADMRRLRMNARRTSRNDSASGSKPCDCSGSDLHRHATDPSQHYHYCPEDVRFLTKHNHADRYKSRPRSEKRAYGSEKFCSINPSIRRLKRQRGSINSQVKPYCADNHHHDDKALRCEHRNTRPHMGGNKQSACRSSHCKPNAFEDMGRFSYAESHRRTPNRVRGDQVRTFFCGVEGTIDARGVAPAHRGFRSGMAHTPMRSSRRFISRHRQQIWSTVDRGQFNYRFKRDQVAGRSQAQRIAMSASLA